MDVVTIRQQPPGLRRPVLVVAFEGWNDAGEAASGAADVLADELDTQPFADIDPEEFFDFQLNRPHVHRDEDGGRVIEWPRNEFSWGSVPGGSGDMVILAGTEPNLRWRTFADAVVEMARDLGVQLVVTLGALQVDAPHTRAVPVTGSASPDELGERLGLRPSGYEGPTGMTGVLHDACARAGLHSVTFWAGIPHYLAGTSYLAGSLALAEAVIRLLAADLSLGGLAEEAAAQRDELSELVADDTELAEYVAELESRLDAAPDEMPDRAVSGDELAAAFERYLRDRRNPG